MFPFYTPFLRIHRRQKRPFVHFPPSRTDPNQRPQRGSPFQRSEGASFCRIQQAIQTIPTIARPVPHLHPAETHEQRATCDTIQQNTHWRDAPERTSVRLNRRQIRRKHAECVSQNALGSRSHEIHRRNSHKFHCIFITMLAESSRNFRKKLKRGRTLYPFKVQRRFCAAFHSGNAFPHIRKEHAYAACRAAEATHRTHSPRESPLTDLSIPAISILR